MSFQLRECQNRVEEYLKLCLEVGEYRRYILKQIEVRDFEKAKADGLVEEIWTGFYCWIGGYNEIHGLDLYGAGWAPEDLMV